MLEQRRAERDVETGSHERQRADAGPDETCGDGDPHPAAGAPVARTPQEAHSAGIARSLAGDAVTQEGK
jgi:hypothetical protein